VCNKGHSWTQFYCSVLRQNVVVCLNITIRNVMLYSCLNVYIIST
jgi:hypothetical protein